MPRRQKRFSLLDRVEKLTEGTATNTTLTNYRLFKQGLRKANAGVRPPESFIKVQYGIIPFGEVVAAAAANDHEIVTITQMSNSFRIAPGALSNAQVGYAAIVPGMNNSPNFYPAQAIVKGPKGALTPKVSGITGNDYKSNGAQSYTIPFGQHAADADKKGEFTQRRLIATALRAVGASSVSFQPEELNGGQPEYTAGP